MFRDFNIFYTLSLDGFGFQIGAGLTLEELIELEERSKTHKQPSKASKANTLRVRVKTRKQSKEILLKEEPKEAKEGQTKRRSKVVGKKEVEPPEGAELIAKTKKAIIYKRSGAIIIEQRYVNIKKVQRNMLSRDRKRGELYKVAISEKVTEKPVYVMIPAIHADDPVGYLKMLESGASGAAKTLIKEALGVFAPRT